jgi:hypothetical protein
MLRVMQRFDCGTDSRRSWDRLLLAEAVAPGGRGLLSRIGVLDNPDNPVRLLAGPHPSRAFCDQTLLRMLLEAGKSQAAQGLVELS